MDIKLYDRKNKRYIIEKGYKQNTLNFLYNNICGRMLLKIIISKPISNIYAMYMNSKLSKKKINPFIKEYNINMESYSKTEYKSFNDFFIRKKNEKYINIDKNSNSLISIADSKLKCYKITDDLKINIKHSTYLLSELINNNEIVKEYKNGFCLIFRLTVDNYHRYSYIDNGKQGNIINIKGKLHTVSNISQMKYKVYSQNSRCWQILNTDNFEDIIQIEVGALLVGKIHNHKQLNSFVKGEEKGYFDFGGSTIIVLIKDNIVNIDNDILENSKNDIETIVQIGEKIGGKIC